MEYFKSGSLNDLEELQKISQTAYVEAFLDLLNKDDAKEYIMSKYSLDNLKKEFEDMTNHLCQIGGRLQRNLIRQARKREQYEEI